MTSSSLGIVIGLLMGRILDLPKDHIFSFKLFKMIIFNLSIAFVSFSVITYTIYDSQTGEECNDNGCVKKYSEIGSLFKAFYVICFSFNPTCFLLSSTLLAKIAKPRTRGSFFALNGLMGSATIICEQMLGSATASHDSAIVFVGASLINGLALFSIAVLAFLGKLKL